MSKLQTTCKKCGSNHVRLIDNEPLFIPNPHNGKFTEVELYQWDEEIYATILCDDCGETNKVLGQIKWLV